VTANLANFAYDPINWPHLLEAEALDVFLASLESQDQTLKLHGIAALCNICLGIEIVRIVDYYFKKLIFSDKTGVKFIREQLQLITGLFGRTDHPEIVLHSLALFYQLLESGAVDKDLLLSPLVLRAVQEWRVKAHDQRIVKLCQLLLQDFATRIEVTQLHNAPILPTAEQPSTSAGASG